MKNFKKPPSKQKMLAIGFTIGVHTVALVGLLYLGMSKPPEAPKQIKTVLVNPEDLKPVTREETEFDETAHENVAEQITQTAEPTEAAPVIPTAAPPVTSPTPKVDTQKAAQEAKAAEAAQRKAEQQAAEAAKRAEAAEQAKAAAIRAKAEAAQKSKA